MTSCFYLSYGKLIGGIDGKIVAEIKDNEWQINPNNYFKRNYDSSALEIIDEFGYPVLQIELLNQNTIKLGGIIYTNRVIFIIDNNQLAMQGLKDLDLSNLTPVKIDSILQNVNANMEELFVYPSSKHMGERKVH